MQDPLEDQMMIMLKWLPWVNKGYYYTHIRSLIAQYDSTIAIQLVILNSVSERANEELIKKYGFLTKTQ